MDHRAVTKQIIEDIWTGKFADDLWRNRPPMTQTEFDSEVAEADEMIEYGRSIGSWETVALWTENRQGVIDFFASHRAA